ncbi:MAG: Translation initiation factor IF-3 [candidate division TM6 bacterium GW2011_GWE2_31_21]|nr:MAG: Translation initiation factor IF-3 [candidate division TM6 bacterium GW2011_GWE2_31_21]KKP53586.1 MAG: Translation initiation factor IF-3 [candidate division TM6 bacterium GW2011_GWF2_33_332]
MNEKHEVNETIKNLKIQVIDEAGVNHGVLSKSAAIALAVAAGLDLVKVGEKEDVAIAKIMNFGKFLFSKKKKLISAKKHQKVIQVKELKFRPKIGIGDYKTKINQAIAFLEEGKHVKFTLQIKGRQAIPVRELGNQFFERIKNDVLAADLGQIVEDKESRSDFAWSKILFIKGK